MHTARPGGIGLASSGSLWDGWESGHGRSEAEQHCLKDHALKTALYQPKMNIWFSPHNYDFIHQEAMQSLSFFCERAATWHSLRVEYTKRPTELLGGGQTSTTKPQMTASAAPNVREKVGI